MLKAILNLALTIPLIVLLTFTHWQAFKAGRGTKDNFAINWILSTLEPSKND
jgi:hypothetical protein